MQLQTNPQKKEKIICFKAKTKGPANILFKGFEKIKSTIKVLATTGKHER